MAAGARVVVAFMRRGADEGVGQKRYLLVGDGLCIPFNYTRGSQ